MRDRGALPRGESLSLPTLAEIEVADWPALQRLCSDLGLNPKGRSAIVKMRVWDLVRRRTSAAQWRPTFEHEATLLTRLGFPRASMRIWESLMRLDAPGPWFGLGAAFAAAGDLDEALRTLDRAIRMGDAAAYLHRAHILATRGDFVRAIEACDRYLAAQPDDLRATAMKALYLDRRGMGEEAAGLVRSLAESRPEAWDAWRGLGILSLKGGRPEPAEGALRAAITSDENDTESRVNLGTLVFLGGARRKAIAAYRSILKEDSSRAEAWNNLGVVYLAAGQWKAALSSMERAAEMLDLSVVNENLARARALAAQARSRGGRSQMSAPQSEAPPRNARRKRTSETRRPLAKKRPHRTVRNPTESTPSSGKRDNAEA